MAGILDIDSRIETHGLHSISIVAMKVDRLDTTAIIDLL